MIHEVYLPVFTVLMGSIAAVLSWVELVARIDALRIGTHRLDYICVHACLGVGCLYVAWALLLAGQPINPSHSLVILATAANISSSRSKGHRAVERDWTPPTEANTDHAAFDEVR
jgi:hypothetical protein